MSQVVINGDNVSGTVNTVPPLAITATVNVSTDKMSVNLNEVALENDVKNSLTAQLSSFPYTSTPYTTPGVLKFSNITEIQLSTKTTKNGNNVVIEGNLKFVMSVITPAIDPATGTPDPTPSYNASTTISPTHSKFFTI